MPTHYPADDDRSFWRGEIVFDRKRTDILSDPLCVVSRNPSLLREYRGTDDEKYHAIKHNDTNCELANIRGVPSDGLPDDTPCVDVAFLDGESAEPTIEGRTYTYPKLRLARVVGDEDDDLPQYRPPMMATAQLIQELKDALTEGSIDSPEELIVMLMEQGVDGEMLAAANEL